METIVTKTCSKCKEEKPLDDFARDSSKNDGHRYDCRECRNKYYSEWEKRNPDKVKKKFAKYYASHKKENAARSLAWQRAHPERRREIAKEVRERNPERKKFFDKRYYENHKDAFKLNDHKRRARIKGNGGSISRQEWKDLCEKYGNRCINPNCPDPTRPVTLDHIIPIKLGGLNIIENAQPLCKSCNSRKNIKIINYRKLYE